MTDYWMEPDGTLIKVPKYQHEKYALELIKKTEDTSSETYRWLESEDFTSASDWLHKKGWVRIEINPDYEPHVQIFGNCIDLTKPMHNTIDPAMTAAQIRVATIVCEEHNCTLYKAINDKMFW